MNLTLVTLIGVIALPVIGALFSLLMPSEDRLALRQIAMAAMIASGLLAFWVALQAFAAPVSAAILGVQLRADALAALVLVSLGFGAPIALRAGAPRVHERTQFYVATMLFAHGLLAAAVVVQPPLLRLGLASLASVPMFALVALFGGPMRGTTTYRAALIWLGVDMVALAALALLAARAGVSAGEATPAALARGFSTLSGGERSAAALALAAPGLLRIAAGPFSVWLQSFLDEAPVSAAMLVAMGASPVGALLLVDVSVPAAPGGLFALHGLILWIAAGAALLSGTIAIAERDLRRVIAQLWFLSAATAAVALVSDSGAAIAAGVVHVAVTGVTLALALGATEAIERRYESRDATALIGVSTTAPMLAAVLALGLLGLAGIPGLGAGGSAWLSVGAVVSARDEAAGGLSATLSFGAAVAVAHVLAGAGVLSTLRRMFAPPTARGRREVVRVTLAQGLRLLVPTALALVGGLAAASLVALVDGPARERAALVQKGAARAPSQGAP